MNTNRPLSPNVSPEQKPSAFAMARQKLGGMLGKYGAAIALAAGITAAPNIAQADDSAIPVVRNAGNTENLVIRASLRNAERQSGNNNSLVKDGELATPRFTAPQIAGESVRVDTRHSDQVLRDPKTFEAVSDLDRGAKLRVAENPNYRLVHVDVVGDGSNETTPVLFVDLVDPMDPKDETDDVTYAAAAAYLDLGRNLDAKPFVAGHNFEDKPKSEYTRTPQPGEVIRTVDRNTPVEADFRTALRQSEDRRSMVKPGALTTPRFTEEQVAGQTVRIDTVSSPQVLRDPETLAQVSLASRSTEFTVAANPNFRIVEFKQSGAAAERERQKTEAAAVTAQEAAATARAAAAANTSDTELEAAAVAAAEAAKIARAAAEAAKVTPMLVMDVLGDDGKIYTVAAAYINVREIPEGPFTKEQALGFKTISQAAIENPADETKKARNTAAYNAKEEAEEARQKAIAAEEDARIAEADAKANPSDTSKKTAAEEARKDAEKAREDAEEALKKAQEAATVATIEAEEATGQNPATDETSDGGETASLDVEDSAATFDALHANIDQFVGTPVSYKTKAGKQRTYTVLAAKTNDHVTRQLVLQGQNPRLSFTVNESTAVRGGIKINKTGDINNSQAPIEDVLAESFKDRANDVLVA